jgi:hypothetical protein
LPSHPPHASSRTAHYVSAMYFRHLAVYWRLSLLSRCAAKRTKDVRLAKAKSLDKPNARETRNRYSFSFLKKFGK